MAVAFVVGLLVSSLVFLFLLRRLLYPNEKPPCFTKDGKRLIYDGAFPRGRDHQYVFGHAVVANMFRLESSVSLRSQDIRKALVMLTRRFPMLRMEFRWEKRSGEEARYLQENDAASNKVAFTEEDSEAENWAERMETELHRPLPDARLLWRVIRLKEQHDNDKHLNTFILTYHHSISDGLSTLAFIDKFVEYLDADDGSAVEPLPLLPPVDELLQHETSFSWWKACLYKLKQFMWKSPPTWNLYLETFPPVMKSDPSVSKRTCVLAKSLAQEETMQLVRKCKANKCTVTGALMAATAIAQRKIIQAGLPKLPLNVDLGTAVNIRDSCKPTVGKEQFGPFVSFCPLSLHLPACQDLHTEFWGAAGQLSESIQMKLKNKEHLEIYKMLRYHVWDPIEDFRNLSEDCEYMGRRSAIAEFSNVGRFHCQTPRHKLLAFHFAVAQHLGGGLFYHGVATVNGQLCYTLVYSSHVVSFNQARELLESIFSILKTCCHN